ncbi:predicted protein [Sclerotinia sclerotiorum 1980 UF-70]|uniref:Uncharacterized protein n=1 Tax=Sclerotinia sclerotiorum (strain ATCC 18683 / 1980 / Ss-1) TaxID=665079 RepID=A7EFH2_SCLS1|nr:predicted protein [Sclerotinia sclerotiorum 1980 UF-70]EDO01588.1 predicted protein [Sclerotinia sclerotiorum 1980 UF-70]
MGGESGKQRRASSKEFNLLSPDTSYFFDCPCVTHITTIHTFASRPFVGAAP